MATTTKARSVTAQVPVELAEQVVKLLLTQVPPAILQVRGGRQQDASILFRHYSLAPLLGAPLAVLILEFPKPALDLFQLRG